jgi:hypothetical protein
LDYRFINQQREFSFPKEILKKFGMENYAPSITPITTSCKLNRDDDAPEVDQTMYRYMIGSLIYLMYSRPDIMQVIGLVGRF